LGNLWTGAKKVGSQILIFGTRQKYWGLKGWLPERSFLEFDILLNVILLNVVAPTKGAKRCLKDSRLEIKFFTFILIFISYSI